MLRMYKSFLTVSADGVSVAGQDGNPADIHYSGYPGTLASIDDFYITSSQLAIMETTNSVFNHTLFAVLTPQSVPYFVRVTIASRLATTAQICHDIFYLRNRLALYIYIYIYIYIYMTLI